MMLTSLQKVPDVYNTNLPSLALHRCDCPLSSDNAVTSFPWFLHRQNAPKKEQRSVIKFFCSEDETEGETLGRMTVYCGDKPVSQKKVYEWVENSIPIADDACSGRLSTVTCVEFKKQSSQLIRDNRTINNDEIVLEISVTE
jgi:hypothetical protein